MEGLNSDITKLTPFCPPEPVPLGFQTRRMLRHGFLSNRWGLQESRCIPGSSMTRTTYCPSGPRPRRSGSSSGSSVSRHLDLRSVEPDVASALAHEIQSHLDDNYRHVRAELQHLWSSVRALGDKVDDLPKRLAACVDQLLEQHVGARAADHSLVKRIHELEKHQLISKHDLEVGELHRRMDADMERLRQLEAELESANARVQTAANDLAQAWAELGRQQAGLLVARESSTTAVSSSGTASSEKTARPKEEDRDRDAAIKKAFLQLRASILAFSQSSAVQLGRLPDAAPDLEENAGDGDSSFFCPRGAWNRASARQRSLRVMAKIFQLLFRRILRPRLRAFVARGDGRGREMGGSPETRLRALEKEMEVHNVDERKLRSWVSATIDAAAPLIDVGRIVEGVADEVVAALAPVVRFEFTRNSGRVRDEILAICQQAGCLKLAMRGAPGGYKIEVPSRNAKAWGGPGCDDETRALGSRQWLRVVEREPAIPDSEGKKDDGAAGGTNNKRAGGGDIACIPFGALTRMEEGPAAGQKRKVVLVEAWVVSREGRVADEAMLNKRKAESSIPEQQDEQAAKRVHPNRGISPAHLARIKALMDAEWDGTE